MTPEQKSSEEVRLRHAQWQGLLFRNNSGVLPNPDNGRPIRFGLGNESKKLNKEYKSGDYIGITPIVITPEMVGKTIGVFTNIEVKAAGFKERTSYRQGTREYAQLKFNELITKNHGIAGFASCWIDVDRIIQNFRNRYL